jgi:DNA-binding CsgD family transcriptional regulator
MAASAQAASRFTHLLERESEVAELASDFAAAEAGAGRLVLVRGPPGIGKTALLSAARSDAQEAGMRVTRARGIELESEFAFGVVRQLLEPPLRACSARERKRLLNGPAGLAHDVLDPVAGVSGLAGDRLPEVMHGLYWLTLNLADRRPLLAVIDDAQWADWSSLRFLSYLAGRLDGARVVVVAAVREVDDEALRAAAQEPTSRTVHLRPLSAWATAELLQSEYGEAVAPQFARACHVATGGNPFFLHELACALRADHVRPTSEYASRVAEHGPVGVARSVLTRIGRLSPDAAAVARALAVLGGEADLRHVAELSSLEESAAAAAVDVLAASEIVVGAGQVAFAHPIVRTAIYSDIPAAQRDRGHLRAARLLAAAGAEAERVAVHLLHTRPGGDAWRTSVLATAGSDALSRGDPGSAVAFFTRALSEAPAGNERGQLMAWLGRAEHLAHHPGASAHLIEAMHAAPTAPLRGELALEAARSLIMAEPDGSEAAVHLLDRAIAELGQPDSQLSMRLEAHLLAAAGLKLSTRPIHRERIDRLYSSPLGDDPAARLLLANLAFWTLIDGRTPGRFDDLAAHANGSRSPADAARRVAERAIGDGRLVREEGADSELLYFAIAALCVADFLDPAEHWLNAVNEDARKAGSVGGYAVASSMQAEVAYRRGDLSVAEAHARAAHDISREDTVAVLVNILIERGQLDEAQRLLKPFRMASEADHLLLQPIRLASARLQAAQGHLRGAADELIACAEWLEAWPARNPGRIPWRSTTALVLTHLNEHERARELAAEEVALAQGLGQPRALGIALRARGLIEPGGDGTDLLKDAITALEGSPARLEHARALVDYGAAIRRSGHRVDARRPLLEGLDLAHRCGATALTQRARDELKATGARPRRYVLTGRDALTPTEARVAQMAAQGHSTPEIAQALFVTPKTIETHLAHTYQKLDIHTRADLVRALNQPAKTTRSAPDQP